MKQILGTKKEFGKNKCSFCQEEEDFSGQNGPCCTRSICSFCTNVNHFGETNECILCSMVCHYCDSAWKQKDSFTCNKESCIDKEKDTNEKEELFVQVKYDGEVAQEFLMNIAPYLE